MVDQAVYNSTLGALQELYENKILAGGTISGTYVDVLNPTILMTHAPASPTSASAYDPNIYCTGNFLMEKLNELKALPNSHITDVRGRGLIIGIDLDIPQKDVRQHLIYNEHCFTGCTGTNTLRLLPPLCINQQEADSFIEKFKKTLARF